MSARRPIRPRRLLLRLHRDEHRAMAAAARRDRKPLAVWIRETCMLALDAETRRRLAGWTKPVGLPEHHS